MKLTIVICTHNRAALLSKTLESINNAIIPAQANIVILVIANACSDDTLERLQEYQRQQHNKHLLPIEFTEESKAGKSHALNQALTLILDGWIGFIDDDHRVDENYFKSVIDAIVNSPNVTLFCGKIIPDWTGQEPPWVHEKGKFKITPFPVPFFDLGDNTLMLSEKNSIPGGGNLIVEKKVFERIGNFSEALGPKGHNLMGSEDSDFILRALKARERLEYIPAIVQYHYVDLSHLKLTYLVLKSYQRNRSITLTHYPERVRVPNYLWIKLGQYIAGVLFSFNINKIRFHLTKAAGIAGQIVGSIQTRNQD
jgi:GT2 family glycosyltransferase